MKLNVTHKLLVVLVLFCRVTALSAAAAQAPHDLRVDSEGHRLTVRFPLAFQTQPAASAAGITRITAAVPDSGQYLVTHQDFPDIDFSAAGGPLRAANILLDRFRERSGGEIISRATIAVPGKPDTQGLASLLRKGDVWFQSRSFIIGHRYYIVIVEGNEQFVKSAAADRFLKSARVTSQSRAALAVERTAVRTNQSPVRPANITPGGRQHSSNESRSSSRCQQSGYSGHSGHSGHSAGGYLRSPAGTCHQR